MPNDGSPSALDALFWREEILQILFWMEGEGLFDSVSPADILRFLPGDHEAIQHHLERCREQGYVERTASGRYVLTEKGRQEGGRLFAEAFDGMQKQGHGECHSDCVCFTEGPDNCPAHHE